MTSQQLVKKKFLFIFRLLAYKVIAAIFCQTACCYYDEYGQLFGPAIIANHYFFVNERFFCGTFFRLCNICRSVSSVD